MGSLTLILIVLWLSVTTAEAANKCVELENGKPGVLDNEWTGEAHECGKCRGVPKCEECCKKFSREPVISDSSSAKKAFGCFTICHCLVMIGCFVSTSIVVICILLIQCCCSKHFYKKNGKNLAKQATDCEDDPLSGIPRHCLAMPALILPALPTGVTVFAGKTAISSDMQQNNNDDGNNAVDEVPV